MALVRSTLSVFLVAAALSACNQAESPPAAEAPTITEWATIPEADLRVAEGISYRTTEVGGVTVAEISGVPEEALSSGFTGGVGVTLPGDLEARASGHQVRVTVRAASAAEPGAMLGAAYSTSEVGNSGWQQFAVTTTPAEYSFVYDVAPMVNGYGDYVGFRSYGADRVYVYGYRVDVLGPVAAAPSATAPTTP